MTILPIPKTLNYKKNSLERSVKYMPYVGLIVGSIGAMFLYVLSFVLPLELAVLLSIIITILITGAMHEDGLADFFDGLGGWYDRKKFLEIMKDSRIGMYGTLATVSAFSIKVFSLIQLNPVHIILAVISAHTLARFFMIMYFYTHEYVRANDESNYKPRITGKPGQIDFIIASIPVFIVSTAMVYIQPYLLFILVPVIIVMIIFGRILNKFLGGFTGDCFGAIEQILEVVIYLGFVVVLV